MTVVIGLTGQIGSGKSLAAAILAELGAAIIDADKLARQVVEPGQPAYDEIAAVFGPAYLLPDGGLDRKALAALVFADAQALRKLNTITHPRIYAEAKSLVESYRTQNYPLIVLEAALLIGNEEFCRLVDEIWLITAPPQQIYARLKARDALSAEAAAARLAAQLPPQEQARAAQRLIVNDGSPQTLREALLALYRQTTGQA